MSKMSIFEGCGAIKDRVSVSFAEIAQGLLINVYE